MPHISVKMLKGRTEEQKKALAEALAKAMEDTIGASPAHISVSVEDYTPVEWQGVFKCEITDRPQTSIYREPHYDPADMLKK